MSFTYEQKKATRPILIRHNTMSYAHSLVQLSLNFPQSNQCLIISIELNNTSNKNKQINNKINKGANASRDPYARVKSNILLDS